MIVDQELYRLTGRELELEARVLSLIMPSIKQQIYKAIRNASIHISKDGRVDTQRIMDVLTTSTSAIIGAKNGEQGLLTMAVAVHTTLAPIIEDMQEDKS